jgi:DNA segregation ATPase FtsK/SpoIIIE, S-DNA-T family
MRTSGGCGMAVDDTYNIESSLSESVRRFVRLRGHEFLGLVLLALVIACGLSLATWSINDPSPNNATDAGPENWLGFAGAAIADQLLRYLGLGSLIFLFVPLVWSLRLIVHEETQSARRMFGAWILSIVSACASLSVLPGGNWWPLPMTIGGQVGDVLGGGFLSLLRIGLKGIVADGMATIAFGGICVLSLMRSMELDLGSTGERLSLLRSGTGRLFIAAFRLAAVIRLPRFAPPGFLLPKSLKPAGRMRGRMIEDDDNDDIIGRITPERGLAGGERKVPVLETKEVGTDEEYDVVGVKEAAQPRRAKAPAKPKIKLTQVSDNFELPDLSLLVEPKRPSKQAEISREALEENARALEGVLDDFGVKGQIVSVKPGPVVTLYELEPAPGIKSSRVISLADDIARSMSAISARVAVVQGRNAIGIELPNARRETVYLREMFLADAFVNSPATLSLALGKNIGGEPIYADLARMPHLLIAGTTGSGKSVGINTMILSLLYRLPPDRCKLIMIDPKMLELSVYEGIPHLLAPVVTDPRKAVVALKWAVREMEERYKKMSKVGVRNVDGYNTRVNQLLAKGEKLTRTVQTGFDAETGEPIFEQEEMDTNPMPYIVVIIDEMADLMIVAGKDIEGAVQRLAQMARAAGIHVVMATQRPSVDVITGTIKANFPTRISFQVTSKIDSRTILGEQGAEQLLGQGDMLYMAGGGRISRLHGPFVSDAEVEAIVKHLRAQGAPDYVEAVTEEPDEEFGETGVATAEGGSSGDSLYDQAVAVVLRDKKVSTSYIQRRLQIGYNKAASLIERMEQEGLISSANATGKREILVPGDSARD